MGSDEQDQIQALHQDIRVLQQTMEQRFQQVHGELKDLSECMRRIIRFDEWVANHTQQSVAVEKRLGEHDRRLHDVEIALAGASPRIGMNEWFVRLVIAGVMGAVMWVLRGSLGA